MIQRVVIGVLLALCAAMPCAAKGVIRGRLLPGGTGGATAPAASSRGGLSEAVIYLDEVPDKVERKLVRKAGRTKRTIVQKGLRFNPRVMAVVEGDTVRVMNHDRVYHNAFSVSPAKRFDLGKYPPGTITPVTFDKPGVVNLHCDIHPKMAAFVVVVPNHVFTQPDTSGRYALPRMPRGTYTLKAWHPRLGSMTRQVDVPKRGDVILDLSF